VVDSYIPLQIVMSITSGAVILFVSRQKPTLFDHLITLSSHLVKCKISFDLASNRDTLDAGPKRIAFARHSDIGKVVEAGASSIAPDGDYNITYQHTFFLSTITSLTLAARVSVVEP
jgi:hypothetical protein